MNYFDAWFLILFSIKEFHHYSMVRTYGLIQDLTD